MRAAPVYALFEDPDSARRAVRGLRAAGVASRDITVISSEPFEHDEFDPHDKAGTTWIYWIAAGSGGIGVVAGYALTSITQQAWPLETGGMPIVSMWTNFIIMFELAMLFAVLATASTLLVTAELLRPRPPLYDREVSAGRILVGLDQPGRLSTEVVERALAANEDRLLHG